MDYSVAAADLLKDWTRTVVIFSRDETLFLQRRRPAGVGTWWSTCCTALLTWPAGCRADRDGPVKQKSTISNHVHSRTTDLHETERFVIC